MERQIELAKASAERMAFSIEEFCDRNGGISRSLYYKLKAAGKGPREMRLGSRVLVTGEAEADWRRAREAEAEQTPEQAAA